MKNIKYLLAAFAFMLISCEYEDSGLSGNYSYDYIESYSGGDKYNEIEENPFIDASEENVSTFSIDADGASYANVRRFIQQEKTLPPKGAVRTEELINYFDLDYTFDQSEHPISLNGEVSQCPWSPTNKLIRIGIKGKPLSQNEITSSNFVFLIDVSGSMSDPDKLELLKQGFKLLVDEMSQNDKIAIVTYAGSAGVVLESTNGSQKDKIKNAINKLGSGGSTAGAEGIITAYEIAQKNIIEGGNNRVIIGTDGDFNVGPSSQEELVKLIEEKRELGIYLTVLGVGRGNLNDAALEQIANNGNGTYEYIDNVKQLEKVFIHEKSKFFTVAKDVKVQVEFNPNVVEKYRLIGYENRVLDEEDFEDDKKDAGEIGADQNITALYEIVPKTNANLRAVPTFTIDFRYKLPAEDTSIPMKLEIYDEGHNFSEATNFMKFTASVASYGMLIRDSQYKGESSYSKVIQWLDQCDLSDNLGLKKEFRDLVIASQKL